MIPLFTKRKQSESMYSNIDEFHTLIATERTSVPIKINLKATRS